MTQGLVTVRQNGQVKLKIVAGCDGYNATKVATGIRHLNRIPTIEEAYELATLLQFGARESLVVLSETGEKFEGDEDLSDLYRSTFDQPEFNPRWLNGTADYVIVVDL